MASLARNGSSSSVVKFAGTAAGVGELLVTLCAKSKPLRVNLRDISIFSPYAWLSKRQNMLGDTSQVKQLENQEWFPALSSDLLLRPTVG